MGDLIGRQDAVKAVANYLWHYPNEQYKNLNVLEVGESLVKDALSIVPSVDAVEVVRCKDCKWHLNGHLCKQLSQYGSIETPPSFYCGFGERKEP